MSRIDSKKALVSWLSILATCTLLAGCGGGGSGSTTSSGSVTPSATASPETSSPLPSYPAPTSTGTGTATLQWVAPKTRTDGSAFPLSALAGYVIYSGTSPTSLRPQATVVDPTATQYVLRNLASGKQYFAIAAYDNAGRRSPLSEVLSKLI